MKKIYMLASLVFGMTLGISAQKNVILYIGDGFGIAPKTAARMAMGQGQDGKRFSTDPSFKVLALDNLKYQGSVTTHSLNSWITDSAPGATVYACGQSGKVDNEIISLDPATKAPLETIMEKAKKMGMAIGVVTTTRVTHATPAAFISHIWFRDLEGYISAQYISKTNDEYMSIFTSSGTYLASRDWELPSTKVGVEIDVILGGGARFFFKATPGNASNTITGANGMAIINTLTGLPATLMGANKGRSDGADLVAIAKQRGYTYVNSRDALLNLDYSVFNTTSTGKLLGLFHDSHMSYEQDRQLYKPWEPSLSDMTQVAIEVLKRKGGDKGFILVVEGGRIDHLGHANAGGLSIAGGIQKATIKADSTANPDGLSGTQPGIYGSDYMIKEVLAFDYAVAEGRNFLNTTGTGNTLVMSTSDHECGGFAVVALHDEADLQVNGTKIRTYANTIAKSTAGANPLDGTITRGDGGNNGWYPDYTLYNFQGKNYPAPSSATAKRLVVSYGSNPVTNGSYSLTTTTSVAFGSAGNHTPQDILIYADDNLGGAVASKITGRGQLDNTDLNPIMLEFINSASKYSNAPLSVVTVTSTVTGVSSVATVVPFEYYPNPVNDILNIRLTTADADKIVITIYDITGKAYLTTGSLQSLQGNVYQLNISSLSEGYYIAKIGLGDKVYSAKIYKH